MSDWQQESNKPFHQISDFEHLGRAYKHLVAQVEEKIINERGEFREDHVALGGQNTQTPKNFSA